jgi:hypothetical protein
MTKYWRVSDEALGYGVDLPDLVRSPMAKSCVHGNKLSSYIPYHPSGI